ncbi:hypothetical protein Lal_00011724 [Lupinus albus]|uniref:Uncharacterized protein n=1 Tax=Lupinus albus TaxID=3870 RepID=A0A6A4QCH5_LUPAL|nr:hypothetical protein Lalb_Chr06g0163121 [Lupinus albus]KAF1880665.1 hypothetical protein Lal_00011724 [Lupinus albus]
MASHLCHSSLMLGTIINKGCQPLLPCPVPKPEIIRYQAPSFMPKNPCEDSRKSENEWFGSNHFVNVHSSAQRPVLIDTQVTCPSAVRFGFGIIEQCTEHDKVMQFIMSGTAEAGAGGVHMSLLSDLMDLKLSGIDDPRQALASLLYPYSKSYNQKPSLDIFHDSALSSKISVHPDGQVTFMGTAVEMKNLLSVVAESYLTENSHKGEKRTILVPHFSRLNIHESEGRSHSSTLEIHSALAVPLRSPGKVKSKPSQKRKKVGMERDLYKKNYLHACESLLSLMIDKKRKRKTAILSLKKSGPELPELLTQFSASIAGTGLAVLLSVICKVACGRVPFCASKLLNTGFGIGLVWLSGAVNKLRDTIVSARKLGLRDEEMIREVDKSIKEVYVRAATLLAIVVLRLA